MPTFLLTADKGFCHKADMTTQFFFSFAGFGFWCGFYFPHSAHELRLH
jgi:hypothetical protein